MEQNSPMQNNVVMPIVTLTDVCQLENKTQSLNKQTNYQFNAMTIKHFWYKQNLGKNIIGSFCPLIGRYEIDNPNRETSAGIGRV